MISVGAVEDAAVAADNYMRRKRIAQVVAEQDDAVLVMVMGIIKMMAPSKMNNHLLSMI